MTVRYVGSGGSNANDGLSWANRRLTLTSIEGLVAAGDTVYVGPGVYRETLTCTTSGTAGNLISYIADVSGANTDGVGGIVRITGSDDDQTVTRSTCLSISSKNYRTFRGFMLDSCNGAPVNFSSPQHVIVEDCTIYPAGGSANKSFYVNGASQLDVTLRRCLIFGVHETYAVVQFEHSSTLNNIGHVVENCVILNGAAEGGVSFGGVGGCTVRNCLFLFGHRSIKVGAALAGGQTITVNNCVFGYCNIAIAAQAVGEIVENYNTFDSCSTNRQNTSTGANSVTYPALLNPMTLLAGYVQPQMPPWSLSEWSQIRARTGTGTATTDLLGITRPTTAAKVSWGPVQYQDVSRSTTQRDGGSGASLKLADAGEAQFVVPVTAVSTTISVKAYREANYAGTNPRLVISQPGQSDRTTTDAGSSGAFNTLTDTFTPAAAPPYVVVKLQSLNTATSGSYAVYFDTLAVS